MDPGKDKTHVVPFRYCAVADAQKQPDGAQNFLVRVDGVSQRVYFDVPVGWLMVAGEVVIVDGLVTSVEVGGAAWVKVAVCGLATVTLSFQPTESSVRGLCYMKAVVPSLRREAYQKLGSFPTFEALRDSGLVELPVRYESYGHAVHVVSRGDESLLQAQCEPQATVGGVRSGHVYEEYKRLASCITGEVQRDVLVFLRGSHAVYSPADVGSSTVLEVPVVDTRVNGEWAAQLSLASGLTSAIMLPTGCRLLHDGVTYGCDGVRVFAVFRLPVQVQVLPAVGRYTAGDPPVSVTYVSSQDTHLNKRFATRIDAKGTHARFIRMTESSVLLQSPVRKVDGREARLELVQVDDPLEDWRALDVVRLESNIAKLGDCYVIGSHGWAVLHAFRTSVQAVMVLDGVVRMTPGCGPLMVHGEHWSQVGFDPGIPMVKWSIRLARCVDDYSMDGGGPSDSEYSDAV